MKSSAISTTMADAKKSTEPEESERALGKMVAIVLPIVTVTGCVVMALVTSAGPAILVLVGGTLLGTISLLWASLRTLSGDAPLPVDLEAFSVRVQAVGDAETRKKSLLMALKDLEHERAIGKIEEADYEEIAERYREEAKTVMRAMDKKLDPMRARAEEIAVAHLRKRGLAEGGAVDAVPAEDSAPAVAPQRLACPACTASNEPDAVFCKSCGAAVQPKIAATKSEASDAS